MRRSLIACLWLCGCEDNLYGWWDLDEWKVERDGRTLDEKDAGFLVWGDPDYGGGFEMGLSYVYDATAFDLVPDPHPEVGGGGPEADAIELTPEGEADFTLYVGPEASPIAVPFDIAERTPTRLRLETVTPLLDGSTWIWRLHR